MKRVSWIVTLLVLGSVLLAGCKATPTPAPTTAPMEEATATPTTEAATPTPEPTPEPEKVTIDWWHIWPAEPAITDVFNELTEEYMAEHPNVEIVITTFENEAFKSKMTTVMQSGEPPDVFQTWGGALMCSYADAGLMKDLTPYVYGEDWGKISEGVLSLYKCGDKVYGVPWRAGLVGMWYNKDHFAQAGIAEPPKTWAELLEDIDKLKAAGLTPIAVGEGDMWPGMFWYAWSLLRSASPDEILAAINRTGTFNSEGWVAAGQRVEELVQKEPFQEGFLAATYGDAETLMATGQASMQLMGHWAYGYARTLTENPDEYDNFIGWFPFPVIEGEDGNPTAIFGGGDAFGIGANAPEEAIDFVRFLTSPYAHQKLIDSGAVPIPILTEGVTANFMHPLFNDMVDALNNATFMLNYLDHQLPPPLNTAVNEEVQKVFAGQATGQDLADALEQLAQEHLDQ